MKIILFLITLSSSYAATLVPRNYSNTHHRELEEVITNTIFEELIKVTKDLKPPKNFKKEKRKSSLNRGKRGRALIEEMKRKNREKIAKRSGVNPDSVKSGNDLIKAKKEDNKKLIKEIQKTIQSEGEWRDLAKSEIEALKKRVMKDWKAKHAKMIQEWEKKQKQFNKEKEKYGETTFKLPEILPVDKKDMEKKVEVEIEREYSLVANSLSVPIRDQKFRPTCAAFAGVRLLDILLAQNRKKADLSEQYFYWASKDDCQKRPCNRKGSWAGHGYKYSTKQYKSDIPLESDCPYNKFPKEFNETQIPLIDSCGDGYAKVGDYQYHQNLDEVIKALDSNKAVIASMTLTPNFYGSNALILYKDRNKGKKMDAHAEGHATVLIGYVKLPSVLNEGSVCFITANSWGEGWGKGGHACISEKWILKQRQVNPFVTVGNIQI
jgi:C1A family cysteine protease